MQCGCILGSRLPLPSIGLCLTHPVCVAEHLVGVPWNSVRADQSQRRCQSFPEETNALGDAV